MKNRIPVALLAAAAVAIIYGSAIGLVNEPGHRTVKLLPNGDAEVVDGGLRWAVFERGVFGDIRTTGDDFSKMHQPGLTFHVMNPTPFMITVALAAAAVLTFAAANRDQSNTSQ